MNSPLVTRNPLGIWVVPLVLLVFQASAGVLCVCARQDESRSCCGRFAHHDSSSVPDEPCHKSSSEKGTTSGSCPHSLFSKIDPLWLARASIVNNGVRPEPTILPEISRTDCFLEAVSVASPIIFAVPILEVFRSNGFPRAPPQLVQV